MLAACLRYASRTILLVFFTSVFLTFLNSGKRVSNMLITCLEVGDSLSKGKIIPNGLYSLRCYTVKLRRFKRGLHSISLLVG